MAQRIYGTRYIGQDQKYRVTFSGTMTKVEAKAECNRLNAVPQQVHDFDTGLGIGGLGRHEERPYVPTVAAIDREMARRVMLRRCSQCGATEDGGAMFTTGGGSVCDDCF